MNETNDTIAKSARGLKNKPQWIYLKIFLKSSETHFMEVRALTLPGLDHTILTEHGKQYQVIDIIHVFGVGRWDTPYQDIRIVVEDL